MPLFAREWTYSDGNVVGTVTYGYSDPWYTYTYASTYSSQVVTLPSDALGQAQAGTTYTTSTETTAYAATAPSTTRFPTHTQGSTSISTTSAESQASTASALSTPLTQLVTSLGDGGTSASPSSPEGGLSHSSGASLGVITSSAAVTQALAGSSSTGDAVPTGPSRNLTTASPGRSMNTATIAGIVLAAVLAMGLVGMLCFAWRRRGRRRRESSFIQHPFLWRSDAASITTSTMSEAPSRTLTPSHTPAEWHTFGDYDAAYSMRATTSTVATLGHSGGLALSEKSSELPPAAMGPSLRFSAAFPASSSISSSSSPPTSHPSSTLLASESRSPTALALTLTPPPAVHDTDQLPSPASTLLYGYAWDHLPPPGSRSPGGRASSGTVSMSYSSAMADSEVGSRPPSYSRY